MLSNGLNALTPGAPSNLGIMFIAHLHWKFQILPGGFDRWRSGSTTNGYPAFVPWYMISAEFADALLLIPGIHTRLVSLYILPMMLGAAQFLLVRRAKGGAQRRRSIAEPQDDVVSI